MAERVAGAKKFAVGGCTFSNKCILTRLGRSVIFAVSASRCGAGANLASDNGKAASTSGQSMAADSRTAPPSVGAGHGASLAGGRNVVEMRSERG